MPPLAESVGFLVRIVQLQSFQLFYRRFDNSGLSIGALSTLGAIHANPGIRHGVLADALMIKRPNFTKVINGLEADGLIAREAPRGDKRTTALFITKKGVRKLDSMRHGIMAHTHEMVSELDAGGARHADSTCCGACRVTADAARSGFAQEIVRTARRTVPII